MTASGRGMLTEVQNRVECRTQWLCSPKRPKRCTSINSAAHAVIPHDIFIDNEEMSGQARVFFFIR